MKLLQRKFLSIITFLCIIKLVNSSVTYPGFSEIDDGRKTFIVIGDTQNTSKWEFWRERNNTETIKLFNEIARRNPAFILHLGDLTAGGQSQKHWMNFEQSTRSILDKRIPLFPILGNHEYYGNNRKALQNYYARFPYLEHKTWYSFISNRIGFIMLNSNLSNLTQQERSQQQIWYINELEDMEKNNMVDYVIVCCHHPPYTNSQVVGPSEEMQKYYAEPFKKLTKTSIFFSGHCHSYERFKEAGKYFIVSGGGGGPRHHLQIDPASRKFADQFNGPSVRFLHFCEIEPQESGLVLRVVQLNEDTGSWDIADEIQFSSLMKTKIQSN